MSDFKRNLLCLFVTLIFPLLITNCKKPKRAEPEKLEFPSSITFYQDQDGDGFGSSVTKVAPQKDMPKGFTTITGDCDDNNKDINPSAKEICNGKDDNCDEKIDEGVTKTFFKDSDSDGYTDGTTSSACAPPSGYSETVTQGDCNDFDKNQNPNTVWYQDNDKDNFYGSIITQCEAPQNSTYTPLEIDCDDSAQSINPSSQEICDGKDNDCDGQKDGGLFKKGIHKTPALLSRIQWRKCGGYFK